MLLSVTDRAGEGQEAMRYGSICSGIEACSVAWEPLGWECAFMSEIAPFPRAVLEHHYPDVPLHGDFTTIERDQYGSIDLIAGGTPCQSFSQAGLRRGLDDCRGNLTLEYIRLAGLFGVRWFVWENVPGAFTIDRGRTFAEVIYRLGKFGYSCAWRVFDAQYARVDGFCRAVPQRRNRIILVGYLGDWRYPAAVLFEPKGSLGDSPPSREKGTKVASCITASSRTDSTLGFEKRLIVEPSARMCKGVNTHLDEDQTLITEAYDYWSRDNRITMGTGVHPTLSADAGKPSLLLRRGLRVRKLTPLECEKLQGFPDHYTRIPYSGKPAEKCPDGPRYTAIGNSMAVNKMRWVGMRIDIMERFIQSQGLAA